MGRQNGDATVASSSIALLQERFRELQKIREKRQEKELLKMFSSESERRKSTSSGSSGGGGGSGMYFEPNKVPFQPEMNLPNRAPALQDSLLSLALNSQSNNHADITTVSHPAALWPNHHTSTAASSASNFESDVDTSLHL